MKQLRRMMLVCVVVATMVSCAALTGSAAARGAPRIPKLTKLWTYGLIGPGTAPSPTVAPLNFATGHTTRLVEVTKISSAVVAS